MTERPYRGFVNWNALDRFCPNFFEVLDDAIVPQATEIAARIRRAGPGRLSPAWLAERGFVAVVRPSYVGGDLGEPLSAYLRDKATAFCIGCTDTAGQLHAFLRCPVLDQSFAYLTTAFPMGDALVFDLREHFAVYMWGGICHVVAGPEQDLPSMLGESIADVAQKLQRELDETPHDRPTITELVRDIGGPQAKLMGLA